MEHCNPPIQNYDDRLLVKDLRPNIGLYWYLVIEIFEQFRFFFVFVFQMIAFVFSIPLGIRFKNDGLFVMTIMALYVSFMKSYPSLGDISLYYGLLNCFAHLFPCKTTRIARLTYLDIGELGLVVGIQFGILAMSPVFYNLWLYSGAGNANFF